MNPLPWYQSFGIGTAGAFVVYCLMYRETRFAEFIENPREHWRVLFFDLVIYLGCGGLLTVFWAEPKTFKEAFTTGCAWQGIAGATFVGTELKALKRYTEKQSADSRTRTQKSKKP